MQLTVRARIAGWAQRWRAGSPLGSSTAAIALGLLTAVAIGAVVASAATGSAWPAVVLPGCAAALAYAPVPEVGRHVGALALALLAVVIAVVEGSLLAVVSLAVAGGVAGGVAAAAVWARRMTAARMAAAHELVDAVSVIDEVTGCYNANGLDLLAQHVLSSVRRSSGAMHASLVEVADLAAVREAGGEEAVREVVCSLADALRSSTRGADVVGRWSPNVFVVLGPGTGVPPAEMERRLRARLLGSSGRPATRWAAAVTVGSGMLEPWDSGGLSDLVSRAEQDLGLRRALRSPSAPQPTRRRRRASDRADERPAPER